MPAPARSARKERDRLRRQEDFLSAAERLFAERGYYNTSIEEIADAAEYGTGTIYRYFKTKEDLYVALLEKKGEEYMAYIRERVAAAATPLDKIRALVYGKLDFCRRHKEFFRIYAAEYSALDWTLRKGLSGKMEQMYYEFQKYISHTLAEAMKPGGIRKTDPKRLAIALTGLTNTLLLEWLKSDTDEPIESLGDFVFDLMLKGLER